jgi:hypothetical protein
MSQSLCTPKRLAAFRSDVRPHLGANAIESPPQKLFRQLSKLLNEIARSVIFCGND